jgi:hypothetical protein
MYTDGMVLTVTPENGALPRLLTSALIVSRGLRLTSVPIDTTGSIRTPEASKSEVIQPCTILYPNGAAVAAISSYGNLIFRGTTTSGIDGAIKASAASEILKGATICSRFSRPWGDTTAPTVTPTFVPYSGYRG